MQHRRNEAICFKLFWSEGVTMTKVEFLKDQAARAERLARNVMDALTADRLRAFAAECRTKAETEQRLTA